MSGRISLPLLAALAPAICAVGCGTSARADAARTPQQTVAGKQAGVAPASPRSDALVPAAPAGPGMAGSAADAADQADSAATLFETLDQAIPASAYDPEAAAAALGGDPNPDAVMQWVVKHTRLVPYRGVLRGIAGSLIDGRVNTLERARLLADLLTRTGREARLVHATLDGATAAALLEANPPGPVYTDPLGAPPDLRKLAASDAHLGAPLFDAVDKAMTEERRRTAQEVASMTARESAALLAMNVAANQPDRRAAAIDVLRDYWWVQVHEEDSWRDLDPSRAQLGGASPMATPVGESLPESNYHKVALRLVAEFWEHGKLRRDVLLETTIHAAAAADERIKLVHRPLSVKGGTKDPGEAVAHMAREWAWLPVLAVGDAETKGRIFAFDGKLLEPSDDAIASFGESGGAASPGGLGGMLGGGFGGALGGGSASPRPAAPDEAGAPVKAAAEWLEVTTSGPSAPTVTARRAIFDLIGAAARASAAAAPAPALDAAAKRSRALALSSTVDVLAINAIPSAAYTLHQQSRDFARLAHAVAEAIRHPDTPPDPANLPAMIPVALSGFAANRWLQEPRSDAVFLDRPNVIVQKYGFGVDAAGHLVQGATLDIVDNRIAVHPAAAQSAFALAVAQGVADTVTEAYEFAPGEPVENTALLFARDLTAKRAWLRLTKAENPPPLRADQRAMIQLAIARGDVAVVPPAPADGMVAWWQIDPHSGATVGIGSSGAGQASLDYAQLTRKSIQTALCGLTFYVLANNPKTTPDQWVTGMATAGLCFMANGMSALAQAAKIAKITGDIAWMGFFGDSVGTLSNAIGVWRASK